jgi:uncharacterized protein YgiB involved in biofilm formation
MHAFVIGELMMLDTQKKLVRALLVVAPVLLAAGCQDEEAISIARQAQETANAAMAAAKEAQAAAANAKAAADEAMDCCNANRRLIEGGLRK